MKKALVAGALGVTGRTLVNHLVSLGDWEVFGLVKFTFAHLPGNNGVDVGVVHNDESRSAPADRTSWQELQRSCHGRFMKARVIE